MGQIYAQLKKDKKKLVEKREKQIKWCMTMADLACSWCQFGSQLSSTMCYRSKSMIPICWIFSKISWRLFQIPVFCFPFLWIYSQLICIINVIIFGLDLAEGFCDTLCLVSVYSAFRSEKKAWWKSWCHCALDHQRCAWGLKVWLLTTFHNELGLGKCRCPLTLLVNLIPLESFIEIWKHAPIEQAGAPTHFSALTL